MLAPFANVEYCGWIIDDGGDGDGGILSAIGMEPFRPDSLAPSAKTQRLSKGVKRGDGGGGGAVELH